MRIPCFLLLALCALPVSAVSIVNGPLADAVTHSTVRVTWETDAASSTSIRWGLTPELGNLSQGSPQTQNQAFHAWFLSGLPDNTEIFFSACSDNACSPVASIRTQALPELHPAAPQEPLQVDTTPPVQTGTTFVVGPDCDDPATGLVAQWRRAEWGDTVVIPATVQCSGNYVFPPKEPDTATPHRWIVTRGSRSGELPEGRVTPAQAPLLSKIWANTPDIRWVTQADLRGACFAGGYAWVSDAPRAFKLYQCINAEPRPVADAAPSGDLVLTVPQHGIEKNRLVRLDGVDGVLPGGKGTFLADPTDPDTLRLKYYVGQGAVPSRGAWSGSGTVAVNTYMPVTAIEGTERPSSCTTGEWFFNTSGRPEDSVYRCVEPDRWMRVNIREVWLLSNPPAINLAANQAHHLRFVGLEVATMPWPAEPLWSQYQYVHTSARTGSLFYTTIFQGPENHHIVWERCYIHGNTNVRSWYGIILDGSNVALVDSYLDGYTRWTGVEPDGTAEYDQEATAVAFTFGPGPAKVENNYIEAYGINLFLSDDGGGNSPLPADYEILRNHFRVLDTWRYGSAGSNGRYAARRHLLELKRGLRWRIEGNRFEGGWVDINQAAAIALTPRPGPGVMIQGVENGAVHCYYPHYLQAGDWVRVTSSGDAAMNRMWRVAQASSPLDLQLEGYNGSSGFAYINKVQSDSTVADILVQNNIFINVSNGIFLIGHTDGASYLPQLPTAARIRIHNNLFWGVDGSRTTPLSAQKNGNGGYPLYVSLGVEDLIYTNNTAYRNRGPGNYGLALEIAWEGQPSEGLLYKNNIVWGDGGGFPLAASGTWFGQAALDKLWRNWTYQGNVIARTGGAYGSPYDPSQPPFGPYPEGTAWYDLSMAPFPFLNAAIGEFRLTGAYTNVGVDFDVLQAALEQVTAKSILRRR